MKKGKLIRYASILLFILFCVQSAPLYAASMQDYCLVPPYVKKDVPPNIMILMDNSEDMLKSAYIKGDATYVPGGSYEGYFENNKYYEYKANKFEISTKINPNPGTNTQATLVVSSTILFKGALLNWATTSRFDLLQKVLIGGMAASRQANDHTLISESGEWKKTYSGCKFEVSGGELTIKDDHGTSCSLLDTSPTAIALNARPTTFASSSPSQSSYLAYLLEFLIKNAYAAKPVKITTKKLPDGMVGESYSPPLGATLEAKDGTTPYTWSIQGGTCAAGICTGGGLPAGLQLNQSTGVISGTPTTEGTYSFTVKVTDATGTDTKDLDIKIKASTTRKLGPMKVRIDTGGVEQKGIVQDFLGSARWGLMTFRKGKPPYVEEEIKERTTNADIASFVASIENIGMQKKAPIGKGYYGILNYFRYTKKGDAWDGAPGKDPFEGDTVPCRKNFVLTISSVKNIKGGSDTDMSDSSCMSTYTWYDKNGNTRTDDATNKKLIKHSCYGYKNDLRSDKSGKQNVYHYGVFTFGDPDDCTDSDDIEENPDCDETSDSPRGKNKGIFKASTQAGGGMQEGRVQFYDAGDTNLKDALTAAITDILRRAAAGTAASVLASGEGSGANLIQAVFYPRKKFFNSATGLYDEIAWIGRLTNYWYYVDPFFTTSTILDDSGTSPSDKILNLSNDKTVILHFDTTTETTMADRYSFGSTTLIDTMPSESVINLWEAGVELWKRDISTTKRKIYTTINGTSFLSGNFSADTLNGDSNNSGTLRPYLDLSTADLDPADGWADGDLDRDGDVDDTDASILIRYIHGEDSATINSTYTWLRSRTVAVDLNGDGDTLDSGESAKVWRLGDVLNSTPKISSWIQLNTYDSVYSDKTYKDGTTGGFVNTSGYKGRGMVFTGANDGMLHAFKLGTLEIINDPATPLIKARLTGSDLGKEMWAFIPKNALPYLKYLADPGYCHVYTVDLTPYIFDASIAGNPDDTRTVNSWRTILIGGMRFGGACKPKNVNCSTDTPNSVCAPAEVSGTSVGFSSYFALDVTEQNNPQLLWEFSHPQLGFATTGPAVVRVSARTEGNPDRTKNGHWFVVFGSGPTGPIDTATQQFLGRSDQPLRLFVLDLKTGNVVSTINTGIGNAFAGSMLNTTLDSDLNYQDDVVYIPYVKRGDGTWNQGGVLRLLTKEDPSPSNWAWSYVMDDIGPVTSSVTKLLNKNKGILWLYFGTGRYYFELGTNTDDPTAQRQLFGVKEPCFSSSGFAATCPLSPSVSASDCPVSGAVCNVTIVNCVGGTGSCDVTPITCTGTCGLDPTETDAPGFKGWYINLDEPRDYTYKEGGTNVTRNYRAERVITDPLSTTTGLVFFTTYKPYNDICAYGGKSFIWAVKYSTGGALGALLKGVALLQVSTGAIEQINLSEAFTEAGGRKTSALEGVPPTAQGLSILSPPPPVKRVIHMRER